MVYERNLILWQNKKPSKHKFKIYQVKTKGIYHKFNFIPSKKSPTEAEDFCKVFGL